MKTFFVTKFFLRVKNFEFYFDQAIKLEKDIVDDRVVQLKTRRDLDDDIDDGDVDKVRT